MMDDIETTGTPIPGASPNRGYPESWGAAPGSRYSETRASWVKGHVRQHMVGAPLRQLEQRDIAFLNWCRLRLVEQMREPRT